MIQRRIVVLLRVLSRGWIGGVRCKGKREFKKWSQSGQERKMSRTEALALRKEENGCY